MPATLTYPGVYIEEVPSGVRTIVGVSTSVAAFIDSFPRGPIDEAVRVLSFADFEREFGGLHAQSGASYGIQQFFLNGGTEAWVVRVADGAVAASLVLHDSPGGSEVVRVTAGQRIRGNPVDNPGEWGNRLRLEVDHNTTNPQEFFNLTFSEMAQQGGRLVALRTESFRNLTMRPGASNNAIEVVNERSRLVQMSRDAAWPAILDPHFRPAATGTLGAPLPAAPTIPANGSTFRLTIGIDSWVCTIDYGGGAAPTDYASLRPFVEAAIRAAGTDLTNPSPLLAGAVVELVETGIAANPFRFRVLAGRSGPDFNPESLMTFADNLPDTMATDLGLVDPPNVQLYSLGEGAAGAQTGAVKGVDGNLPGATHLRGVRANKTGLYALEDVDIFNILCIPRAAELANAAEGRTVYSDAEQYCLERRAFLIVDIPAGVATVDAMQTWASQNTNLRHTNAAVYFPRPRIADPLNQYRLRSIGASGTVAGLYSRTDGSRGVWKAPGGVEASLRNVQELAYVLTDPENGVLNPLGINCLRSFPVYGNVCWGARTLVGADVQASEWKYIPIRRLALFIEESLYRGTKWVVFEPNDEPLWAQIRLNVGAFMHQLFRQGAFQGSSPREAYFVKCDGETTTQADRNLGIVNIIVGFAPLKPAEFVVIKIQQIAGEIQT
jgi:phage tail sheath protein FI